MDEEEIAVCILDLRISLHNMTDEERVETLGKITKGWCEICGAKLPCDCIKR